MRPRGADLARQAEGIRLQLEDVDLAIELCSPELSKYL